MIAATIMGNLGADAELKYLPDGTAVIELRVASNSREKDGPEWKDVATWCRVSLFGKRAESLGKLGLTKGTKIAARGAMKLREFDRKDGGKGASLEMRADDVELMGSNPNGASAQRSAKPPTQQSDDSDLPF